MLVLITYDVNTETASGKKRLRKVAKQCENYGRRVQNSVFECILDQAQSIMLKQSLVDIIDENDHRLFPISLQYMGNGLVKRDRILVFGEDHHRTAAADLEFVVSLFQRNKSGHGLTTVLQRQAQFCAGCNSGGSIEDIEQIFIIGVNPAPVDGKIA